MVSRPCHVCGVAPRALAGPRARPARADFVSVMLRESVAAGEAAGVASGATSGARAAGSSALSGWSLCRPWWKNPGSSGAAGVLRPRLGVVGARGSPAPCPERCETRTDQVAPRAQIPGPEPCCAPLAVARQVVSCDPAGRWHLHASGLHHDSAEYPCREILGKYFIE